MFRTRSRGKVAIVAAVAALALLAGCGNGTPDAAPSPTADATEPGATETPGIDGPDVTGEFPRNETIFTTGTMWGPPSHWNPIPGAGDATGNRGLIYETLFHFNPNTLEMVPWLAESGERSPGPDVLR